MSDAARYVVPVSGPVAYVLARLLDRDEVARRLDAAGFRGTPQAESFREEVLSAVALIRERGEAWHAAQRGERAESSFTSPFTERGALDNEQRSSAMHLNAITQSEAAKVLGITPQRVGQLRKDGQLYGWQDERGRWLYDRDEIQMFRDDREERSAA